MKTRNSSAENIQKRRNTLSNILLKYQRKSVIPSRDELLKELEKSGFHIDLATLYRDRTILSKGNTWIEDLGESNFSAYCQNIYDSYEFIASKCLEYLRKEWVVKTTKTKNDGKDKIIETSETDITSTTHIKMLTLLKDINHAIQELMDGSRLDVTMTLLARKLDEYKEELNRITIERDKLKEK